jgi:hypothetical protein
MEQGIMPKRIEMVYQDALNNIGFIKKQEWIIAGYGLTIHAAAVALWNQFGSSLASLQCFLTVATVAAAIYGILVLVGFAQGLIKWRKRLDWIYRNYFDERERAELALGQRPPLTETIFIGGLSLSLVVSAAISLMVIWRSCRLTHRMSLSASSAALRQR